MTDTEALPGRAASPWLAGADESRRGALGADREADVVVVGGGMIGMTTAAILCEEGADVVLLEGGSVGQGVTGRTTAKLTSLQGLKYADLLATHGTEKASAYAQANEAGIGIVAALVEQLGIDCELRRKDNFTYTEDPARRDAIEEEVQAANDAGLAAECVTECDLPFPVAAAVRLGDQADFQPVLYLRGLADHIDAGGQRVFERSRVTDVSADGVRTDTGVKVAAERVVLATHLPIVDRGGQFATNSPYRSHALGVRLDGPAPAGMYLSAHSPTRSLRAYGADGDQSLLIGGESGRMGSIDPADAFRALERFAHERFAVREITHRWSAHDHMPIDGLPMVGALWPLGHGALLATGMGKWGLAMGAAAARILADEALGQDSAWADTFDPRRLPNAGAFIDLARNGVATADHLVGDRVRRNGSPELGSGDGAVVDSGRGKAALFRDDEGVLHAMSARCTHLGCIVEWNSAERTWDCPCHGSRFGATGAVICGPATAPLEPKQVG